MRVATHEKKHMRWAAAVLLSVTMSAMLGAYTTEPSSKRPIHLNPANPESYLNAGERLAAWASTQEEQAYAHQVLAVGIGLAHRQGEPILAASLCIALSDSEPDLGISQSLWDLALMLDPARMSAWREHRNARSEAAAAIKAQAARCVWAARMGDQKTAGELFNNRAVRDRIKAAALQAGVDPISFDRILLRAIKDHDFDDCRGRVFVVDRVNKPVPCVVLGWYEWNNVAIF